MTADDRFRIAVEAILGHEGGFSDDPADRGGATNFGLSSVHHPDLDVRALTRERAIEEYRRRYWERYRLDEIEDVDVATKVFDLCVWMGPGAAARYLQTAICAVVGGPVITVDGVIGSRTLAALREADPGAVVVALRALALEHIRRICERDPSQERFRRGWERRALA